MVTSCWVIFVLVTLVYSRTIKDDVDHLLTKSGRVLIGVIEGDSEAVHMGINEGGSANAVMEPYFGDMVLRLGKAYVSFPSCPAVHLCLNYGTKYHLNVAGLLAKFGADVNQYRLPAVSVNGTIDLLDRGYPPALLYALGMGQKPENSHAAMLQRMVRTKRDFFNLTVIDQWRAESGNPPLVHLCMLLDNVDGAHVLLSEFGMNVNEADADGVTALHISAWRENLPGMVMLLRQGANVSAVDHLGRTPLHYVVMRGHATTGVKILLASALADPAQTQELQRRMLTQADHLGKTAVDFAAATPAKVDMLAFLQEQARLLGGAVPHTADPATKELSVGVEGEEQDSDDLSAHLPDHSQHSSGGWHYPADLARGRASDVGTATTANTPEDLMRQILQPSGLSLGVDVVDAEDIDAQSFLEEYFSAQRPVLITGQLTAGAGIWAHWEKQDFLARYGDLNVTVGPGEFAETRAALRYEYLSEGNTSFCKPDADLLKKCQGNRQSTYRTAMSVSDYVTRCLAQLPSPASSKSSSSPVLNTTPRCSWDGHAAHASLQMPQEWRWDLPTPGLFDSLCRRPVLSDAAPFAAPLEGDKAASFAQDAARPVGPALWVPHHAEESTQLHLGGAHSGLPLQAHNASWNLLLAGEKKWFLLPPSAPFDAPKEHFVCNDARAGASADTSSGTKVKISRRLGRDSIACVATAREWLVQAVPRLRERRQLVEVTQYQGDVLFIPHDWQYATLNLADTVSVTKEMCTFRDSDARIQPLGSVIYGREDPHRGLGSYQLHRKTSTKVGIKRKATTKIPQFDYRPVT